MKKVLVSLLTLIFIISMMNTVYALSGKVNAGASTDTVEKGKTFTVTLVGTADSPIDGMYTKFTYDKNVLEMTAVTPGENYGNNSGEGEIFVTNSSSTTSPTSATLCTITFKVLDTANVNSTTISFNESALHLKEGDTDKETEVSINNVTVNIKANTSAGDNNNESKGNTAGEQGNNTKSPSNTSNSGNKSTDTSNSNSTTKKSTKLPQTGIETISILAIISLGIISIISYVSYKRYKNI